MPDGATIVVTKTQMKSVFDGHREGGKWEIVHLIADCFQLENVEELCAGVQKVLI